MKSDKTEEVRERNSQILKEPKCWDTDIFRTRIERSWKPEIKFLIDGLN